MVCPHRSGLMAYTLTNVPLTLPTGDDFKGRPAPAATAGEDGAEAAAVVKLTGHSKTAQKILEGVEFARAMRGRRRWFQAIEAAAALLELVDAKQVEPREAWPSGRAGTSAALGRAGGGGYEGLGVSAAGGVGSL